MAAATADLDGIFNALPYRYRGPGGAAAILKDGELIGSRAWGYSNLDTRTPYSTTTLTPICSISKQMVCLALASLCRNPTPAMLMKADDPWKQLNTELQKLLPNLTGREELTMEHLCHMHSGIRDWWAMTTLFGARPEGPFSLAVDAPQSLERIKTFHFAPGTEFSYSNVNFHVVGRVLENVSGQSLSQLLAERVFIPAGMSTAALCQNTNGYPLPIVGYEGSEKAGWFPATNRIEWAGDAGIVASLDDMIAYEKYLDRSWNDPQSLYHYTSQQTKYNDGTPAQYGFGLSRDPLAGRESIRHGGALRGFRLHRLHVPSERISVVVLFNHEPFSGAAADFIFKKFVDWKEPKPDALLEAAAHFHGDFLDEETQLRVHIEASDTPGKISMTYDGGDENVKLTSDVRAENEDNIVSIEGDILHVVRTYDNRTLRAKRIKSPTRQEVINVRSQDYTGKYRCDEVDSTFYCTGGHGTLYASFEGFLGRGPIYLMYYVGEDVWAMQNPRGMDAAPPGDWTIVFSRNARGEVETVTVGCWLARKVKYVPTA